jgi:hydroxyacylglutathione hydrolase
LTIIPLAAFRDNYIWLIEHDGNAAVVDPGDAAPVLAALKQRQLTLTSILLTHHHDDHCGGVEALCNAFPASGSSAALEVFGPASESITGVTRKVRGGDRIRPAYLDLELTVIDVPGHTRGHVAYHGDGALFCGDTLFAGGCGRVFEGTPAQMAASLEALSRLPASTQIYCAHEYTEANLRFAQAVEPGNAVLAERAISVAAMRQKNQPTVPSTLALELATNPFLRVNQPAVAAAAGLPAGSDPVAVFTAVRTWKDRF